MQFKFRELDLAICGSGLGNYGLGFRVWSLGFSLSRCFIVEVPKLRAQGLVSGQLTSFDGRFHGRPLARPTACELKQLLFLSC